MISPTAVRHSRQTSANRFRARCDARWGIAVLGIAVGVLLNWAGLRLEGGAVAILGLAPLFLALERRLFPGLLIGYLGFMYLYCALGYAIGPLWQVHVLGRLDAIEEGLVPAQWGAVLGLVTFAITFPRFFKAVSRWVATRDGMQDTAAPDFRWHSYGFLMLLTAVVLIWYGFTTGSVNRLAPQETSILTDSIAGGFQAVHQVMFFFLGYSAARRRGVWMILWMLTLAGYALFFFLDGGRGTVMTALILSGAGFVWGGAPLRKVLLVGAIAAMMFVPLSGIVLIYRSYYAYRPTSFTGRWSGLMTATAGLSEQLSLLIGSTDILMRNITIQSVDHVFILTPRVIPFAGLEGLDRVPFAFVPEIVRPGRPILYDGNELAIRYGAARPGTTGSYMPAVGDGYRRGGWVGVALLYAFSAAIYGPVMALCWARRTQREWMAMLIFVLSQSPSTLLTNFYVVLWILPKYWVFFWLLRRLQGGLVEFFSLGRSTRAGAEWLRPRPPYAGK